MQKRIGVLILLDAIISLTFRIADIVSAIFNIEVACQPSQRQKYIARTEGQSRLDAPSQPFSAMIPHGPDNCITIKLIFIRCRMPHTLCVLDFGKRYPIIIKWRDAESRLAMQHQARSTTLAQPQGRSTKSQAWRQVDFNNPLWIIFIIFITFHQWSIPVVIVPFYSTGNTGISQRIIGKCQLNHVAVFIGITKSARNTSHIAQQLGILL